MIEIIILVTLGLAVLALIASQTHSTLPTDAYFYENYIVSTP